MVDPDHPGLYFVGLIQPIGAIMPLAEAQSDWVADLVTGEAALPTYDEMRRQIRQYDEAIRASGSSRRSGTPSRWTSTSYRSEIARERGRRTGPGRGAGYGAVYGAAGDGCRATPVVRPSPTKVITPPATSRAAETSIALR